MWLDWATTDLSPNPTIMATASAISHSCLKVALETFRRRYNKLLLFFFFFASDFHHRFMAFRTDARKRGRSRLGARPRLHKD
jgi:hypothetical protein